MAINRLLHHLISTRLSSPTGEITTRDPLDREQRSVYDLVAEARDQGQPARSARVPLHVLVTDVNDNAPEMIDPQADVVSVREEQPPGIEVVRIRAVDQDNGANATVTYALLKGRDSDGFGLFGIDPVTGVIRTRVVLDHEERPMYQVVVAATDGGRPPKQTSRVLHIEVLNLDDNRATFTSSSSVFRVSQEAVVVVLRCNWIFICVVNRFGCCWVMRAIAIARSRCSDKPGVLREKCVFFCA